MPTHHDLKSVRVLVVDDDEEIAVEIAAAFGRVGCYTETAGSGKGAQAAFAKSDFDVLLTDIRMPGGSGIELLGWIKTQRISVAPFVMTGFADFAMEEALRLGALGIFSKPFDTGLIVDTVLDRVRNS